MYIKFLLDIMRESETNRYGLDSDWVLVQMKQFVLCLTLRFPFFVPYPCHNSIVVCGDIDIHALCVNRLGLRSARCGVTVKVVFFSMSMNILPVIIYYIYILVLLCPIGISYPYTGCTMFWYIHTLSLLCLCIRLVGTHAILCKYMCAGHLVLRKY